MESNYDILSRLVSEFNAQLTARIIGVETLSATQWKIQVCNTLNLRQQSIFTIGANQYTVDSISYNYVTATGSVTPSGSTYTAPSFTFFYGTPIQIQAEMDRIYDKETMYPFIAFMEVMNTNYDHSIGSNLSRDIPIFTFFMDGCDWKNWTTAQHQSQCIKPMGQACNEWVEFLRNHKDVSRVRLISSTRTDHMGASLNVTTNGHTTKLFNQQVSGVELRMLIPIKKTRNCDNGFC